MPIVYKPDSNDPIWGDGGSDPIWGEGQSEKTGIVEKLTEGLENGRSGGRWPLYVLFAVALVCAGFTIWNYAPRPGFLLPKAIPHGKLENVRAASLRLGKNGLPLNAGSIDKPGHGRHSHGQVTRLASGSDSAEGPGAPTSAAHPPAAPRNGSVAGYTK